jgi:hypothetical protein
VFVFYQARYTVKLEMFVMKMGDTGRGRRRRLLYVLDVVTAGPSCHVDFIDTINDEMILRA